jgi:transposase, IS5 family
MRRELGQLSLADGLVEGAERNRQLAKIAALVDWTAFERLLGQVYAARVGRPSYGPVCCSGACCCSSGTGCPTPGLEEALADRLSFRRFVGLALADRTTRRSRASAASPPCGG